MVRCQHDKDSSPLGAHGPRRNLAIVLAYAALRVDSEPAHGQVIEDQHMLLGSRAHELHGSAPYVRPACGALQLGLQEVAPIKCALQAA